MLSLKMNINKHFANIMMSGSALGRNYASRSCSLMSAVPATTLRAVRDERLGIRSKLCLPLLFAYVCRSGDDPPGRP